MESVKAEELPLRVAYAEMELNGVRRLLLVETYRGNVCRLAGRGFVEPYITVLDGSKLKSSESSSQENHRNPVLDHRYWLGSKEGQKGHG